MTFARTSEGPPPQATVLPIQSLGEELAPRGRGEDTFRVVLLGDFAEALAGGLVVHVMRQILLVDVELSRVNAHGDALLLAPLDDLRSK